MKKMFKKNIVIIYILSFVFCLALLFLYIFIRDRNKKKDEEDVVCNVAEDVLPGKWKYYANIEIRGDVVFIFENNRRFKYEVNEWLPDNDSYRNVEITEGSWDYNIDSNSLILRLDEMNSRWIDKFSDDYKESFPIILEANKAEKRLEIALEEDIKNCKGSGYYIDWFNINLYKE